MKTSLRYHDNFAQIYSNIHISCSSSPSFPNQTSMTYYVMFLLCRTAFKYTSFAMSQQTRSGC